MSALPQMAAADLYPSDRLRIVYVAVREARKWDRNPKRHDLEGLKAAFRNHGFRDAPIFDGALGALAAGNGRATALAEMEAAGEDPPRGVALSKDDHAWCMPVQMGIDAGSRAQAEAFAIDHNNLTLGGSPLTQLEMASLWDEATYVELVKEMHRDAPGALVTIDEEELQQLEMQIGAPGPIEIEEPEGPQVDRAEALAAEWGTAEGQLWHVGDHLLAITDAGDPEAFTKAVDGKPIEWVWTDPPYGVAYTGRTADALTMQTDDADSALDLTRRVFENLDFVMLPGCPLYVAHPSGPLSVEFGRIFKEQGWLYHETLTWVKNVMVMGHSDYHYQHEPIIYGWKQGAEHPWYGGRDKVTTFFVDRPSRSTYHPTMKPVELVEMCLRNSARRGSWGIDPFLGAGATMVAAQVLDLKCIGLDIDPKYAAVTLQRMKDLNLEIRGPDSL
jgi:hypothetical protein